MKKRNILVYIFLFTVVSFIFLIYYSPKYYFVKQIEDDYYLFKEEKSMNLQIIKLNDHSWESWLSLIDNVDQIYRDGNSLEVSANAKYYSLKIGVTNYPEDVKEISHISHSEDKKIDLSLSQ